MSPKYDVKPTSNRSAEVQDVQLSDDDDTALTRKILRAQFVDNVHSDVARVKACIMHQKRHSRADSWQDVDSFSLATLKSGQDVRMRLSAEETYQLYQKLRDLHTLTAEGIPKEEGSLSVIDAGASLIVTGKEKEIIEKMIAEDGDKLMTIIEELQPNALGAIVRAKRHEARRSAFHEFEDQLMSGTWSEGEWEDFFRTNKWIFGHGLAYRFLSEIQSQPNYGGATVAGTGAQRGDFLMATEAAVRFTVLLDIKKPTAELLGKRLYRNKVYELGYELTGGVSQLQSNCRTWVLDGSQQEENRERLATHNVWTYEPKGILVLGLTNQLDDMNKRATFELFRRNLSNPEVLTYDELLERARFLVDETRDEGLV